ncbi:MAG TPA: hypothetical protein VNO13_00110 [Candidatus Udaeobacter sp.]|nr:hypothetical protein [Candidatus Udaeobacter sp.]
MTEQNKTRRQKLEQFLAQNRNDAFSRYGVALECLREGDIAGAESHFKALLEANPDYVPISDVRADAGATQPRGGSERIAKQRHCRG